MIDQAKIKKQLKEQVENYKKIQKTQNSEGSKELMDSIKGTIQRAKILGNTDIEELYRMYVKEIEDTAGLIFKGEDSIKEKVLNALEYMRITVNRESEPIEDIDKISLSGINAAILRRGKRKVTK